MSARDVTNHDGRTFDVQPSADPRSASWPVMPLLAALAPDVAPRRRIWKRGPVLDQGSEGACVGHGVAGELASSPHRVKFDGLGPTVPNTAQAFAFWCYHRAQKLDQWPGEDYSGTSVNAGMIVARDLGLIESWRWAKTFGDLRDSLITLGPVVLAVPWHDGMYEAPRGHLTVRGEQVGWHCLLANGYDPAHRMLGKPKAERVRLLNSWGTGWGTRGHAWIDRDDLQGLIDRGAEMVVPIGRHLRKA